MQGTDPSPAFYCSSSVDAVKKRLQGLRAKPLVRLKCSWPRGTSIHQHSLIILACLLLLACDPPRKDATTAQPEPITLHETRDFDSIKQAGTLRVLQPKWEHTKFLPRQGLPADRYQELIRAFAEQHHLTIEWLPIEFFGNLIPQLESGGGDIIVTNLTQTKSRSKRVDFTAPLTQVEEVLVVSERHAGLASIEQLLEQGFSISVPSNSSFLETAKGLQQSYPSLNIDILPSTMEPEDIIDLIIDNPKNASIMDSNTVDILTSYRQGITALMPVSPTRNISWAIRKNSPKLQRALNKFITVNAFTTQRKRPMFGDWPAITERKTLRVLTRNHPASYFIWRGQLRGFDYDLLKHFAEENNINLEMIVVPEEEDIFLSLLNGKADMAAANLTQTLERESFGISFASPLKYVTQTLISNADNPVTASSLTELPDIKVTVHRHSSFWSTLNELSKDDSNNSITVDAAPDEYSTVDLIDLVAEGNLDYSVAYSHLLGLEQTYRDSVKAVIDLGDPIPIAWATRKEDTELLQQLNNYLQKEHRGLFYNVTYNKYFKNRRQILSSYETTLEKKQELSPWDDLVKEHANRYGFDWRLITAQMYQESQFNPKAVSFAGAKGLMQVLPRTAKQLGFTNLKDPATSIEAGVAYLNWTRKRFQETLPVDERLRFSLAAYNAGYGHVYDARRLARRLGLDHNRWFGQVEVAMKLLSKPEYYEKSRFGYVRGSEPVNYVREIENRYHAYIESVGSF